MDLLKISINPRIINKNERGDKVAYAIGWVNVDCKLDTLVKAIQQGIAYCAQLSGPRRKIHFVETNVLSVDIDRGMKIEEALQHELVTRHAAFLYTTNSHTDDEHRFRIVFVTPRSITDGREFTALTRSLALRLGGDRNATDPTRVFFGSKGATVHMFGNTLSIEMLDELFEQGAPLVDNTRSLDGSGRPPGIRSRLKVHPDQPITREDGSQATLASTPYKATVFCPFHADKQASAFVLRSQRGVHGIYCAACQTTYWPEDVPDFDFSHFDRTMEEAVRLESTRPIQNALNELFGGEMFHHVDPNDTTVRIARDQAAPDKLQNGLTLIKSPKGTGKTEAMARLTRESKSVLLIGHRIALIEQSCKRLKLDSYLNKSASWSRLGITIDSLVKMDADDWPPYDVVILDECEQLLSHFLSETLDKGGLRERVYVIFRKHLRKAKKVVALDADLDWPSFLTLYSFASRKWKNEPNAWPTQIWINRPTPATKPEIELFEDEDMLVGDLHIALQAGKRCFVTSNSRTKVERIAAGISESLPDIRSILVTSLTNRDENVTQLINNVAKEALNYNVIFTSPSMGTGVDITFPDKGQEIDIVYGFCETLINSHFDFDQQIGRVRHPKSVRVWVSSKTHNFETDQDAVTQKLKEHSAYVNLVTDYDDSGKPIYRSSQFIDMAGIIVARKYASLNNIKYHFCQMKLAQGFKLKINNELNENKIKGRSLLVAGREAIEEQYVDKILEASVVSPQEMRQIKKDIEASRFVTPEKRASYERTWLEIFYRRTVDAALIYSDKRGRRREQVRLLEEVRKSHAFAKKYRDVDELARWLRRHPDLPSMLRVVRDRAGRASLLRTLLQLTPVMMSDRFQGTAFTNADLDEFRDYLVKHKAAFQEQFGMQVRADIERKAVQQLRHLLERLGLSTVKVRRARQGPERRTVAYQLNMAEVAELEAIVERRKEIAGTQFLRQTYGFAEKREASEELDEVLAE